MQTSGENKGWLEQEAPFSNEIEMVILKLKKIVVLLHQFSKLKRLLRDKSTIFYLPLVTFSKRIPDSNKILSKSASICVDFQVQMDRPCT